MAYNGTLEILAVEGKALKSMEMFTKQDPYLKLILDNQSIKTKTHKNGGKNPTWNQTVILNLLPGASVLRVEAWDEDAMKDDFIGSGSINLEPIFKAGSQDLWVDLRTKSGSNAGQIRLVIYFKSKNVATPQQYQGISTAVPNAYVPPPTAHPQQSYVQPPVPPHGIIF
jgi:Ca2+-dependent lipid-binding protein